MRFYTNVQLIGNQFLVRGVDNGRRFEIRDKEFSPTLFVKSKVDTKYKTLSFFLWIEGKSSSSLCTSQPINNV